MNHRKTNLKTLGSTLLRPAGDARRSLSISPADRPTDHCSGC